MDVVGLQFDPPVGQRMSDPVHSKRTIQEQIKIAKSREPMF
jgi:hypothetical protein